MKRKSEKLTAGAAGYLPSSQVGSLVGNARKAHYVRSCNSDSEAFRNQPDSTNHAQRQSGFGGGGLMLTMLASKALKRLQEKLAPRSGCTLHT
eukprot:1142608-Pelagomonas_calceolata.AAC.5